MVGDCKVHIKGLWRGRKGGMWKHEPMHRDRGGNRGGSSCHGGARAERGESMEFVKWEINDDIWEAEAEEGKQQE